LHLNPVLPLSLPLRFCFERERVSACQPVQAKCANLVLQFSVENLGANPHTFVVGPPIISNRRAPLFFYF
jgi:hypothetical protein